MGNKTTTKNFKDLPIKAKEAGVGSITLLNLAPPTAMKPLMIDGDGGDGSMEAWAKAVGESEQNITESVERLAGQLVDEKKGVFASAQIFDGLGRYIDQLEGITNKSAREGLTVHLMGELVRQTPDHGFALAVINFAGEKLGVFQEADEKKGRRGTYINRFEDGRFVSGWRVYSNYPGAHKFMRELGVKSSRIERAKRDAASAEVDALCVGTSDESLATVLADGGVKVSFVPPESYDKGNGRGMGYRKRGNVRFDVKLGVVTVTGVSGDCAERVNRLIEAGTSIMVSQLETPTSELHVYGDTAADQKVLHGLVTRALKAEEAKAGFDAEVMALKATATTEDPATILCDEEVGTCYIRSPNPREKKVGFTLERNAEGKVRVSGTLPGCRELGESMEEFVAPGQNFSKIPAPLGPLLKSISERLHNARSRPSKVEVEHAENGDNFGDEANLAS
ncbi:MAG: hypothetical protein O2794_04335 [bacterium]|nr:hypothetical protein [bacterium]